MTNQEGPQEIKGEIVDIAELADMNISEVRKFMRNMERQVVKINILNQVQLPGNFNTLCINIVRDSLVKLFHNAKDEQERAVVRAKIIHMFDEPEFVGSSIKDLVLREYMSQISQIIVKTYKK
jgi:hypothetical protein